MPATREALYLLTPIVDKAPPILALSVAPLTSSEVTEKNTSLRLSCLNTPSSVIHCCVPLGILALLAVASKVPKSIPILTIYPTSCLDD